MAALVIGETEKAKISELIAFAAANVLDAQASMKVAEANIAAYRDMMNNLSIVLPIGYHITFTHERHHPDIIVRHISISVDRPGKAPSLPAIEMILEAFGMKPFKQSHGMWLEDVRPGLKAANFVQLIEPIS